MLKAYKYRLYPTEEQKILLEKHFGCCRFIYNWALARNIESYTKNKKHLNRFTIQKDLPSLKEQNIWLKEVNSQCLISSLEHVDSAYIKFFRQKKGFPKFKSKRGKSSFQCIQRTKVDFTNSLIVIPKFKKGIKCKFSREFEGKIKTSTISKTKTNKYFISILVETNEEIPGKVPIIENQVVGIDLGIKTFATLSNGISIDNPRHLKKSLKKLKKYQKQHSRKKKGSSNREKSRLKLAKLHEKVANQRKDFLHKVTTQLIKSHNTIALEDLNISGMVKNRCLAQAISDLGIGYFNQMLEYKANWYGKNILRIGQFEPSSKTCSFCGNVNQELTLKDREWTCNNCNTSHDRDVNAALNIKNFATVALRQGMS